MKVPALLALVTVVVAAVAPAAQAVPTCSDAAARAAIRSTAPQLAPFGQKQVVQARSVGAVLCFDATGDGRNDMAVSVVSGGTAGDIGWLFFAAKADGWRLAGSGVGYKLWLLRSGSRVEVRQPVYRRPDPNCCPTGGFDHTLYGWNGKRLAVERAWHTKGPG